MAKGQEHWTMRPGTWCGVTPNAGLTLNLPALKPLARSVASEKGHTHSKPHWTPLWVNPLPLVAL